MNNQFDEPRERICSLPSGGKSAPLSWDELTKSLAQSVTRRAALKKFGAGLTGMALACFGLASKAQADQSGRACYKKCVNRCVNQGGDPAACDAGCRIQCLPF